MPAVFLSPTSVFVAMRNESREDVDARSEPVLALTALAGIAAALASSTARTLYDDPEYDAAERRRLGGHRRRVHRLRGLLHRRRRPLPRHPRHGERRHVPACPPPPRLRGGADCALVAPRLAAPARGLRRRRLPTRRLGRRGGRRASSTLLELGFAAWSAVLLLVGVRAVHGWTLVALPRGARAGCPLPSGVREPPHDLLGPPRRARARPRASRTCAAPPGSGVREPLPRTCRRPS